MEGIRNRKKSGGNGHSLSKMRGSTSVRSPIRLLKLAFYAVVFLLALLVILDNSLKLQDQLWHEVKPGLSSFADAPEKGAQSLLPLLELAKGEIPDENRSKTPLVLKATAGLRMLPTEKADALLKAIRKVLDESGFYTTENSVGIMDGQDEGIFSWFTVNYLLDRISGDSSDTLVALDLGGGSTQITFVPAEEETLKSTPDDHLTSFSLHRQKLSLYTHSYLGLGLMAARNEVLKRHLSQDGSVVHSPCINPIINTQYQFNGNSLTVKGPLEVRYEEVKGQAGRLPEKRPIADYEGCLRTCMEIIKGQVHAPAELRKRDLIAFSYFFDRATERGLIDPFQGGIVTVQQFLQSALQSCNIPNTEQPFACLDLTFIGAFLSHGYGLKGENEIKLYKRIGGYEVSWGLGLAYHVIHNGI